MSAFIGKTAQWHCLIRIVARTERATTREYSLYVVDRLGCDGRVVEGVVQCFIEAVVQIASDSCLKRDCKVDGDLLEQKESDYERQVDGEQWAASVLGSDTTDQAQHAREGAQEYQEQWERVYDFGAHESLRVKVGPYILKVGKLKLGPDANKQQQEADDPECKVEADQARSRRFTAAHFFFFYSKFIIKLNNISHAFYTVYSLFKLDETFVYSLTFHVALIE